MMKKSREGSLRVECRTAWQAEVLDWVSASSMHSESTFGVMKQVAAIMQTGSQAGKAARVNARLSKIWEVWDRLSDLEKFVAFRRLPELRRQLREHDTLMQKRHDAAAARRAERHVDAVCKAAAEEYANAREYYKCDVWKASKVDAELKQLEFKYSRIAAMVEQMQILVVGYGYKQLAMQKNARADDAAHCGHCCAAFDDYPAHLEAHLKWALAECEKLGGKPKGGPPHPQLTIKPPPILAEDQSQNPLDKYIKVVVERAVEWVEKKKVKATVAHLLTLEKPEVNKELVGKDIEMVHRVWLKTKAGNVSKRSQLYSYYGTVLSVNMHTATSKKKGSKEEIVPTARVQWHEEGEPKTSVVLDIDKYHEGCEHGWVVVDDGDESDPVEAVEKTIAEFHEQAKQAQMLLFSLN